MKTKNFSYVLTFIDKASGRMLYFLEGRIRVFSGSGLGQCEPGPGLTSTLEPVEAALSVITVLVPWLRYNMVSYQGWRTIITM